MAVATLEKYSMDLSGDPMQRQLDAVQKRIDKLLASTGQRGPPDAAPSPDKDKDPDKDTESKEADQLREQIKQLEISVANCKKLPGEAGKDAVEFLDNRPSKYSIVAFMGSQAFKDFARVLTESNNHKKKRASSVAKSPSEMGATGSGAGFPTGAEATGNNEPDDIELDVEMADEILASSNLDREAFCAKFRPVLRKIGKQKRTRHRSDVRILFPSARAIEEHLEIPDQNMEPRSVAKSLIWLIYSLHSGSPFAARCALMLAPPGRAPRAAAAAICPNFGRSLAKLRIAFLALMRRTLAQGPMVARAASLAQTNPDFAGCAMSLRTRVAKCLHACARPSTLPGGFCMQATYLSWPFAPCTFCCLLTLSQSDGPLPAATNSTPLACGSCGRECRAALAPDQPQRATPRGLRRRGASGPGATDVDAEPVDADPNPEPPICVAHAESELELPFCAAHVPNPEECTVTSLGVTSASAGTTVFGGSRGHLRVERRRLLEPPVEASEGKVLPWRGGDRYSLVYFAPCNYRNATPEDTEALRAAGFRLPAGGGRAGRAAAEPLGAQLGQVEEDMRKRGVDVEACCDGAFPPERAPAAA
ncbi:unnamed protein product [Prorocentrum cordatum]|uniref:Uncharacterized protein n=1 Tax=Prorocentrum cordatum TaxID=2364126 RepID=A0ABN9VHQ3_9DINO|nr:unnamed protein product [Polarella glacialis]